MYVGAWKLISERLSVMIRPKEYNKVKIHTIMSPIMP